MRTRFSAFHARLDVRSPGPTGLFRIAELRQSPFGTGVQALRTTTRILTAIALTLLVAGCDKCGNWFFTFGPPSGLDACKGTVPQQK
jgi:hypothetical protein